MYPAFSPDGKTLAFIHQPILEPEIDVISLESMYPQMFPNDPDEDHLRFAGLKWPKEQYLVYRVFNKQIKKTRHYVIRLDGGPPEQISEDMEDMFEKGLGNFEFGNTTFAIEPTNRLTTLWVDLNHSEQDST